MTELISNLMADLILQIVTWFRDIYDLVCTMLSIPNWKWTGSKKPLTWVIPLSLVCLLTTCMCLFKKTQNKTKALWLQAIPVLNNSKMKLVLNWVHEWRTRLSISWKTECNLTEAVLQSEKSITHIQTKESIRENSYKHISCNSVWHRHLRNTVSTAYKSLKFRFDWKLISVLNNSNSDQLSWHCLLVLLLLLKIVWGWRELHHSKISEASLTRNKWCCSPGLYEFLWKSGSKQTTTQLLWLPAIDLNDTSLK